MYFSGSGLVGSRCLGIVRSPDTPVHEFSVQQETTPSNAKPLVLRGLIGFHFAEAVAFHDATNVGWRHVGQGLSPNATHRELELQ
jgi:hypothetical protein